ncbi:MAG: hypothetical protein QXU18_02720 [Thermoplasmatales archaeon]
MESSDLDAMNHPRLYLKYAGLNETILQLDLRIDHERMSERMKRLGINALFTDITYQRADDIIDVYRKPNNVEHCFQIISTMDIAFPLYQWTLQEIRIHIFMLMLAYLFFVLIRMKVRSILKLYLLAVIDIMTSIRIV